MQYNLDLKELSMWESERVKWLAVPFDKQLEDYISDVERTQAYTVHTVGHPVQAEYMADRLVNIPSSVRIYA